MKFCIGQLGVSDVCNRGPIGATDSKVESVNIFSRHISFFLDRSGIRGVRRDSIVNIVKNREMVTDV